MAAGNTPSTASFVMTAGSASAVTLVTGNSPAVLPNGTYTITVQQDGTGTTLVLTTPLGTIEQPGFIGGGLG
jgi:hypothetical protein